MKAKPQNNVKQNERKVDNGKPVVISFGQRTVSKQNFSRILALPKQALANLGYNVQRVNVELVQEKGTKFIRLTAAADIRNTKEEEEEN